MRMRLLGTISMLLLLGGCRVSHYTGHEFAIPEVSSQFMTVSAVLRGTEREIDKNNTESGAPYELWLWMKPNMDMIDEGCIVSVSTVQFTNIETGEKVLVAKRNNAPLRRRTSGTTSALFYFKGLNLPHTNQTLEATVSFQDSCASDIPDIPVTLDIEKTTEESRITFWDKLMGI